MDSAVVSGLIGGIAIALVGYAVSQSAPPMHPESGRTVVTYSPVLRGIAVIATLILAAGFVVTLIRQPEDHGLHALLGAFTIFCGGYMLLEFYLVRLEFDGSVLHSISPWTKTRIVPWRDVSKVTYSASMSWHVLHTIAHEKIRVPDWISGGSAIVDQARKHVGS